MLTDVSLFLIYRLKINMRGSLILLKCWFNDIKNYRNIRRLLILWIKLRKWRIVLIWVVRNLWFLWMLWHRRWSLFLMIWPWSVSALGRISIKLLIKVLILSFIMSRRSHLSEEISMRPGPPMDLRPKRGKIGWLGPIGPWTGMLLEVILRIICWDNPNGSAPSHLITMFDYFDYFEILFHHHSSLSTNTSSWGSSCCFMVPLTWD